MIKYVDYLNLKDFYTISECTELFEMNKDQLKAKCEQYSVLPVRNESGQFGFVKYDFRTLHNKLYYEDRKEQKEEDPWA